MKTHPAQIRHGIAIARLGRFAVPLHGLGFVFGQAALASKVSGTQKGHRGTIARLGPLAVPLHGLGFVFGQAALPSQISGTHIGHRHSIARLGPLAVPLHSFGFVLGQATFACLGHPAQIRHRSAIARLGPLAEPLYSFGLILGYATFAIQMQHSQNAHGIGVTTGGCALKVGPGFALFVLVFAVTVVVAQPAQGDGVVLLGQLLQGRAGFFGLCRQRTGFGFVFGGVAHACSVHAFQHQAGKAVACVALGLQLVAAKAVESKKGHHGLAQGAFVGVAGLGLGNAQCHRLLVGPHACTGHLDAPLGAGIQVEAGFELHEHGVALQIAQGCGVSVGGLACQFYKGELGAVQLGPGGLTRQIQCAACHHIALFGQLFTFGGIHHAFAHIGKHIVDVQAGLLDFFDQHAREQAVACLVVVAGRVARLCRKRNQKTRGRGHGSQPPAGRRASGVGVPRLGPGVVAAGIQNDQAGTGLTVLHALQQVLG